jgi:hypothetical protein
MTTADLSAADQALLDKNVAVAAANEAEKTSEAAKAEHVSRSRVVGGLLLEAKKRHPKVADFEAFLKRVNGLKLSRAYDVMRLAGGRTTDDQLRKEQRDRVQKHRAKKKLPKPKPAPLSVTHPDVTETPNPEPKSKPVAELSTEQRKAEMVALDMSAEEKAAKMSAHALAEFTVACRTWLPKITESADQLKAVNAFNELMQRHFGIRSRRTERLMDAGLRAALHALGES